MMTWLKRWRHIISPFGGRKSASDLPFQKHVEKDIRTLKAIITLIIYGLLFLLLKIMYDRIIQFPEASNAGIIVFLSFLLVLIVIMFDRFSKSILRRITYFTGELEQARSYAESIVHSIQIPIVVINKGGAIQSANNSFHVYFQTSAAEMVGKNFFNIQNEIWRISEIVDFVLSPDAAASELRDLEVSIAWPLQQQKLLLVNGRRFRQSQQELVLLSLEDITLRKQAETNLRLYAAKIEEASNAKSDFLANISHELRTPLTAIIGFSEILHEETEARMSPKQLEYVSHIYHSAEHLLSLINDILDLSKIEAGKMTLEPENCDAGQLLSASLNIVREMAASKKIDLHLDLASDLGQLTLDVCKFNQILYNLLSNAVKFTGEGGHVFVAASRLGSPAALLVTIRDTGIGIEAKDLDRLFTPFQQLESSLTRRYHGTGLGLSLVKRLVELQGGRVWVESQLGKGSVFSFKIPYR